MPREGETKDGRFKAEVNTVSCQFDQWTGNELRFDTEEHARQYALDLGIRWTATADVRVVDLEGNELWRAGWRKE